MLASLADNDRTSLLGTFHGQFDLTTLPFQWFGLPNTVGGQHRRSTNANSGGISTYCRRLLHSSNIRCWSFS